MHLLRKLPLVACLLLTALPLGCSSKAEPMKDGATLTNTPKILDRTRSTSSIGRRSCRSSPKALYLRPFLAKERRVDDPCRRSRFGRIASPQPAAKLGQQVVLPVEFRLVGGYHLSGDTSPTRLP